MKKSLLFTTAIAVCMTAGIAAAATISQFEAVTEPTEKNLSFKVGLGVAMAPEYEGSEDYEAVAVPLASIVAKNGMSAELIGNVLRANVIPSNTWRFGPLVRYRAERNDVTNDRVDNMKKVDAATELGVYAGFDINHWNFKVDVTHDTSGVYNGTLAGISLGYTWMMARQCTLTLNGLMSIADDRYMSTYFGVNSANRGTSGFSNYSPDGGIKDLGAALIGGHKFNDQWGLIAALRYTHLVNDADDSPLVQDEGSEGQVLFGVLATYSF